MLDVIWCLKTGATPNGEPLVAQNRAFLLALRLAQGIWYRISAGGGIRIG